MTVELPYSKPAILHGTGPVPPPRYPTLSHAIEAARAVDTHGFTFIGDRGKGDGPAEWAVAYDELAHEAARIGHALLDRGLVPGERLVLVLPDNETFIVTFLGAVWAGLVPVPIYPPLVMGRLGGYLEHAQHIVAAARAAAVITDRTIQKILGTLMVRCPELREVIPIDALRLGTAECPMAPARPEATCFIQFTSGSTSDPKGVQITHGNLMANVQCIGGEGLGLGPGDCGVSWLPLYHDMGLIGFVLTPLVYQTRMVSMSPLSFLKRPHRWLEMMSRHRGTIGFAPNFAYGLCTRRVHDRQLAGLDLSSWRVAGCGAEPIRRDTLDAFADRFVAAGFSREALFPVYGMAEATLAVSFGPLGRGVTSDPVEPDALAIAQEARPAAGAGEAPAGTLDVVACGQPFAGHTIAVCDDRGRTLGERRVGEIALRGPSVSPGYFDSPEATAAALDGGWLKTGDLGYVASGELYVCGRKKELIIVDGKNYYPQDIERVCWKIDGVRTGNAVAFGVAASETEALVVALETRAVEPDEAAREAIAREARRRIHEQIGLVPREVLVLAPGSLPKTSSGKLQRRKTAQLYAERALGDARRPGGKLTLVRYLAASQLGYVRSFIGRLTRGGHRSESTPPGPASGGSCV